jgi:outer membrane lipoprotein-sorting protein
MNYRMIPGIILIWLSVAAPPGHAQDAREVVDAAVRYYRGLSSVCVMDMTILRPHWKRTMTIKAWTKGQKDSIFFIIAPPKDEGNGTLKKGKEMWTYNPKLSQVMKLPPTMMSQGWMGSDFSNDDLAKSDSIIEEYGHTLEGKEVQEGKKVYRIKALPKPGAAVVWGMQRLKIREDHILLSQEFFDEEMKLVKALTSTQIQPMGGKLFPKNWDMKRGEEEGEHTVVDYREIRFDVDLPERLFTVPALKTTWK